MILTAGITPLVPTIIIFVLGVYSGQIKRKRLLRKEILRNIKRVRKYCTHCRKETMQIDRSEMGWFCPVCGNIFPKGNSKRLVSTPARRK